MQRKRLTSQKSFEAAPATQRALTVPESVHNVLTIEGETLDSETRTFMEPRFGHDFNILANTEASSNLIQRLHINNFTIIVNPLYPYIWS